MGEIDNFFDVRFGVKFWSWVRKSLSDEKFWSVCWWDCLTKTNENKGFLAINTPRVHPKRCKIAILPHFAVLQSGVVHFGRRKQKHTTCNITQGGMKMNIILTRKGYGSVRFTQLGVGEMVDVTVSDGVTFCTTPDGANELYRQYIAKGFARKAIAEPKVQAPKAPKVSKPKVSREEALTAKYGDKETRKAYVMAKNHFTRVVVDSLVKWQKEHRRLTVKEYNAQKTLGVKQMLKAWEESGRPSLA